MGLPLSDQTCSDAQGKAAMAHRGLRPAVFSRCSQRMENRSHPLSLLPCFLGVCAPLSRTRHVCTLLPCAAALAAVGDSASFPLEGASSHPSAHTHSGSCRLTLVSQSDLELKTGLTADSRIPPGFCSSLPEPLIPSCCQFHSPLPRSPVLPSAPQSRWLSPESLQKLPSLAPHLGLCGCRRPRPVVMQSDCCSRPAHLSFWLCALLCPLHISCVGLFIS